MLNDDNTINDLLIRIDSTQGQLKPVKAPTEVVSGTVDIDQEMYKLMINLKVLAKLKLWASEIAISYENDYNKTRLKLNEELTDEILKQKGMVRSDRLRYIKIKTCDELFKVDKMKARARYFDDMLNTYIHWLNAYKKTRSHE